MPADRLSVLDDAFLALDSPNAPLHVGWTIRIDGRPPSVSGLRRHLHARMDRVPRFRRRVVGTALAGGELRWEDDHGFDIANHVTVVHAPAGADDEALRQLAGRLLSSPLPLDRPLWRVYLVDGLRDGFAVIGQAHHALIDGIAAIEVAALLFDAEPNPRAERVTTWRPRRVGVAEAAIGLTRDRLRLGAGQGAAIARAGRDTATRTKDLVRRPASPPARLDPKAEATRTVAALTDLLRPAAGAPMAATSGHHRELGLAVLDLEALRSAGRRHDATVNDVLLTCVGHALGRALERRDENAVPLKAMMPVNVRTGSAQDLGNALSLVFLDLPADREDPAVALATVVERTRRIKEQDYAATLSGIVRLADLIPTAGRRAVSKVLGAVTNFDVTVSNVPGPDAPLYLLGRRVRAVFPAVPIWEGQGLTVGALSYCGRMHVCVYADRGVVPDAQHIAADIGVAARRLSGGEALGQAMHWSAPVPAPTPWRTQARHRRDRSPSRTIGASPRG